MVDAIMIRLRRAPTPVKILAATVTLFGTVTLGTGGILGAALGVVWVFKWIPETIFKAGVFTALGIGIVILAIIMIGGVYGEMFPNEESSSE